MFVRIPAVASLALATVASTPALAQLMMVDDLPGTFVDISSTGTPFHLSGDLSTTITSTVSNAVFPAGDVVVSNNGGIAFGSPPSTTLAAINQPIPSTQAFGGGQSLLPYWDDIGNTIGEIEWEHKRASLIIQWTQKPFEGSTDTATFQIQIFDGVPYPPAGGIYAQFIYLDIEQPRAGGGASATIGYQNGPAAYNDVQWSVDTPGAVANGTVLSLIPEPATLTSLGVLLLAIRSHRRGLPFLR
ncbi:MAG TPA: hypothetical protein VMV94_05680 [Phycisphaerae bacterium]|nr:hypothetical protein [Phycisphaerae bacterium]